VTPRALPFAALLLCGAGWGLAQPMQKIAVTEGLRGFGIIFAQQLIGVALAGTVCLMRGRGPVLTGPALRFYAVVAATGIVVPTLAALRAIESLPSGIVSLIIAMVPIFAFPMALVLGTDRAEPRRVAGLALGLLGVAAIALPGGRLPEPAMLAALLVAMIAPFCYAIESHVVVRTGSLGLDPMQTLLGAYAVGAVVSLPLALAEGSLFLPAATPGQAAVALSAVINGFVYAGYVWLVGRAGPVFAAQVAYLITGFGVVWAMLLLGERYPPTVGLAFAALMAGVALVRPRPPRPAAPRPSA
jgi:drug/metabolite transporter (DMT)-like permease